MKIGVVTIAYGSPDGIDRLAEYEEDRHHLEFHLFLHSRQPATERACREFAQRPDVVFYPYGSNRGVSKSWNEGILAAYERSADVVVVANDDVCFSPGDIDKIAAKACTSRWGYIVSCAGFHARFKRVIPSLGYSCFAINPVALENIGCFDENIFPAYCEDQDYARRAHLAGLSEENCADTNLWHAGSATILMNSELARQNCLTQGLNIAYFHRKWGGDAGRETFLHPFNNTRFTHYISPQQRHAPYGPQYDRNDHHIVSI